MTPPGSGVGGPPGRSWKPNELVTISWLAGPPASSPATVKAAPGIDAIEVTVKSAGVPGSVGGTAARQPDSASPVTAAPVAISATLRRTGVLIGVLLTEVERRSTLRYRRLGRTLSHNLSHKKTWQITKWIRRARPGHAARALP